MEAGHASNLEITLQRRDGKLLHLLMSVDEIMIQGEECRLADFYDITERVIAEERFKKRTPVRGYRRIRYRRHRHDRRN